MEVIHPRAAGPGVHKKVLGVAVRLPGERAGERAVTVKRFKTLWRSLPKMADWLSGLGVTDAAMQSAGVYWWPACHALAQGRVTAQRARCRMTATQAARRHQNHIPRGHP